MRTSQAQWRQAAAAARAREPLLPEQDLPPQMRQPAPRVTARLPMMLPAPVTLRPSASVAV